MKKNKPNRSVLIEISGDRFINPMSINIIGIFPYNSVHLENSTPYFLYVGCQYGTEAYPLTKEDKIILINYMNNKE